MLNILCIIVLDPDITSSCKNANLIFIGTNFEVIRFTFYSNSKLLSILKFKLIQLLNKPHSCTTLLN